jgi:hypothetical protein
MLIVNDGHLRLAGVLNLEERCKYCGSALQGIPSFGFIKTLW